MFNSIFLYSNIIPQIRTIIDLKEVILYKYAILQKCTV